MLWVFPRNLGVINPIRFRHFGDFGRCAGEADKTWIKQFHIAGQYFGAIPLGIDGDENRRNFLRLRPELAQRGGYDLQLRRAKIGAKRIAEIEQSPSPAKVGLGKRGAVRIYQMEWPAEGDARRNRPAAGRKTWLVEPEGNAHTVQPSAGKRTFSGASEPDEPPSPKNKHQEAGEDNAKQPMHGRENRQADSVPQKN